MFGGRKRGEHMKPKSGTKPGKKGGIEDIATLDIDPYMRLRTAIIVRAIYDWDLCLHPAHRTDFRCTLTELRRFFKSGWCDFLMNGMESITPEDILSLLEDKREKEKAACFA